MLLLIRGLPKSGKTTLAEKLIENRYFDRHYEFDHFLADRKCSRDDPLYKKDAKIWCEASCERSFAHNASVIVSNDFITTREMDRYIVLAQRQRIPYAVLVTNFHENLDDSATTIDAQTNWEPFWGEYTVNPKYDTLEFILRMIIKSATF